MDWILNTDEDYASVLDIIRTPKLFLKECCDIQLAPHQRPMWDNMHENEFALNLVARQLGKSLVGMAYAYWHAMNHNHHNIVICSTTQAQAQTQLDMIRKWISNGPRMLQDLVLVNNRDELKFVNGTRIIVRACTSRNMRGMTINLLMLDEFAYTPSDRQTEIIQTMLPVMAACSSKMVVTTTPYKPYDQVHAMSTNDPWSTVVVPASQVKDQEWLDEQRRYMSEDLYRREVECKFVS